ncbi:MAG TPA: carbonic anhydrase [Kineosporiaceae bacterium]
MTHCQGPPRAPEVSADGVRVVRGWPSLPGPAADVLGALVEGNARFRSGQPRHPNASPARRRQLAAGQQPLAAFFGCIDSRVPDELVLDQGLGDLLTVRTAAHVLDDAALGSLEFAVHHLRVPLIMVAGHARCGAVSASIEVLEGVAVVPDAVHALVDALRPAVAATAPVDDPAARVDAAVRWHTRLTAELLSERSPVLRSAVSAGALGIVAAHYSLDTGAITPA